MPWGKRVGGRRSGSLDEQMQTIICRMDKKGPTVQHRELYSVSCNKPQWKRKKGFCRKHRSGCVSSEFQWQEAAAAAAAKSLQSCPTLCDPTDSSPPGSTVPGILQARILEWVAISFSNESEKWKWSRSVVSDSSRPHGLQPTRLLRPWDFPGRSTGVGCHCLLWWQAEKHPNYLTSVVWLKNTFNRKTA